MKNHQFIQTKIFEIDALKTQVLVWRLQGKKIVFTNGVFDIVHVGHLQTLNQSAELGDKLIVAVNSDASVKRLKGESRPINNQADRLQLMASLLVTDAVILFEEDTPLNLIKEIMPDVLVKGGDYTIENIVGAKEVQANGGSVVTINLVEGKSTTQIINKIKE